MLKNRYQEILVGLNLMSLVRGLISLRRHRSVLLIDDKRFQAGSYPESFLSEMEVLALLRLGKRYEVPELQNLRNFLSPASVEFITSGTRLRTGHRPFENLRELLRKYPELIDESDLDLVYAEGDKEFDRFFMEELSRYETQTFESSLRPKGARFELQGPKWFKTIYQRFGQLINQEYSQSQDLKFAGLLHLMGVSAEEKLKTQLAPEELPYYFFRLLSPVYRLQDFFLLTQLKRRLLLEGGDYKESMVQYWQFHEGRFENLLLASFEGVISGERVLFFSHLPEEAPFSIQSPWPFFRKASMEPARKSSSPFPPTKLSLMADLSLLGSERPYRALNAGEELAHYHLPYLELPGSKAEFYFQDLKKAFAEDAQLLPFEISGEVPQSSLSVSMDMRQWREKRRTEAPVLTLLPLAITEKEHAIQGFEYWGPFRYRGLGLLSLCYGVEGI